MRAEQKLKSQYRISLVAVLHDWSWAECTGYELLLPYRGYGVPHLVGRFQNSNHIGPSKNTSISGLNAKIAPEQFNGIGRIVELCLSLATPRLGSDNAG